MKPASGGQSGGIPNLLLWFDFRFFLVIADSYRKYSIFHILFWPRNLPTNYITEKANKHLLILFEYVVLSITLNTTSYLNVYPIRFYILVTFVSGSSAAGFSYKYAVSISVWILLYNAFIYDSLVKFNLLYFSFSSGVHMLPLLHSLHLIMCHYR